MAATLDGVLCRRVEAEPGEHHVVVAFAIRVANRILHLPIRYVADYWANTRSHTPSLPVAIHPFASGVEERRTGQRIESAKLHGLIARKIHAAGLEQADDRVKMCLGVLHRHVAIK